MKLSNSQKNKEPITRDQYFTENTLERNKEQYTSSECYIFPYKLHKDKQKPE